MWYIVKLMGRRGKVTLRTFAQDAAQAVDQVVYLFPMSEGYRVLDVAGV